MSVPYEVQGLGDTWSAPVSPWGTRCPNMPTKEWLENAGFLDLNQVNLPPLYEEGNYPSADLPEGAAWTHWSMPLNEAQVARLTGAMAILQTDFAQGIVRGLGAALPVLADAVDAVVEWMNASSDSNLRIGRTVDEGDTVVEYLGDYTPAGHTGGYLSFSPPRNPFWTVAYSGQGGIAGMYLPDVTSGSFTFPLVWSTALEIPTASGGTELLTLTWLSDTLKQAAVDAGTWDSETSASLVDSLYGLAAAVRGQDFDAPGLGPLPATLGIVSAVWDWLIVGFVPTYQVLAVDVTAALQVGLDVFAVSLEAAAFQADVAKSVAIVVEGFVGILDPVAAEVDFALAPVVGLLGTSEWGQTLGGLGASIRSAEERALFGLSEEKAWQFTSALRSGGTAEIPAVIHLSTTNFDYYFDNFEGGYHPDEDDRGAFQGYSETADATLEPEWNRWIRTASPILQYAYTLELAADLLAQMFNAHSVLLAVTDLLSIEGSVGAAIREFVAGAGLSCVDEMLNGKSGGWLIGQVWKQAMVDLLLDRWLQEAGDLSCLYDVFCWMGTEEQRERLDLILDPASSGVRPYAFLASLGANGASGFCVAWAVAKCEVRDAFPHQILSWACLSSLFAGAAAPEEVEQEGPTFGDSQPLRTWDLEGLIEEPTLPHPWVPSFVDDLQLNATFVPLALHPDVRVFLKRSYSVPEILLLDFLG